MRKPQQRYLEALDSAKKFRLESLEHQVQMLDLISMCVVAKHMLLQVGEGSFPFQERALGVSLQSLLLTGQENFYLKSFGSLARSIDFPILCFYPFTAVCSSKLHEFAR